MTQMCEAADLDGISKIFPLNALRAAERASAEQLIVRISGPLFGSVNFPESQLFYEAEITLLS